MDILGDKCAASSQGVKRTIMLHASFLAVKFGHRSRLPCEVQAQLMLGNMLLNGEGIRRLWESSKGSEGV